MAWLLPEPMAMLSWFTRQADFLKYLKRLLSRGFLHQELELALGQVNVRSAAEAEFHSRLKLLSKYIQELDARVQGFTLI